MQAEGRARSAEPGQRGKRKEEKTSLTARIRYPMHGLELSGSISDCDSGSTDPKSSAAT